MKSLLFIVFMGLLSGLLWAADQSVSSGVIVSSSTSVDRAIADIEELDAPVKMVEQEYDPTLLENLPAPSAAPAQVKLPPIIATKDQWKSSQSGIVRPARVVIRNAETWDKLWTQAIRPYSAGLPETPAVDFTKEMVIGVFLGEKENPGHRVEIISIKPEADYGEHVLRVTYRNESKMQAVFSPAFPVEPFHLKRIPAFQGHVTFKEVRY